MNQVLVILGREFEKPDFPWRKQISLPCMPMAEFLIVIWHVHDKDFSQGKCKDTSLHSEDLAFYFEKKLLTFIENKWHSLVCGYVQNSDTFTMQISMI